MFVCVIALVLFLLGTSTVWSAPTAQSKPISQQALLRLIFQRGGQPSDYQTFLSQHQAFSAPARRSDSSDESQPQRRSFDMGDEDFQNCFLSPVQCMLPLQNK
uniref:Uncharacterized protein n=1 Tax=Plectus sambesii TaxID=2011161 RepID=A0A914UIB6_9BILA